MDSYYKRMLYLIGCKPCKCILSIEQVKRVSEGVRQVMLMVVIFFIMSLPFMRKVLTDNSNERRVDCVMCFGVTIMACLVSYILYLIHYDYHSLHYIF